MKCDRSFEALGADLSRVERKCRSENMLGYFQDLTEVIARDLATLQRLGVTCQQVAYRMKQLIHAAKGFGGRPRVYPRAEANRSVDRKGWCCWSTHSVNVDHFIVDIVTWGGAQECPFQSLEDKDYHGGAYGSQDLYVLNTKTDEILIFGSLLPHMIKRHSFFEGQGPYRVDPEAAVRILEIKPDQVRVPRTKVKIWAIAGTGKFAGEKLIYETATHRFYQDPAKPEELLASCSKRCTTYPPVTVAGYGFDLLTNHTDRYVLMTIKV